MEQMRPVTGIAKPGAPAGPNIFKENGGRGMAKRTFTDRMTLAPATIASSSTTSAAATPTATRGCCSLRCVSCRRRHLRLEQFLPLLDANNGGSAPDIADSLMKAHGALIKSADSIVTGHSTVMTFDDLRKWADFNRGFLNQMREAKKAGKTPEEVGKTYTPPAGFTVPENQALRLQANVQTAFNEIK